MEQNLYYNFKTNNLIGNEFGFLKLFSLSKSLDTDNLRKPELNGVFRIISGKTQAQNPLRVTELIIKYINGFCSVFVNNKENLILGYETSTTYDFYLKTNLGYDSGEIQVLHITETEGALIFAVDEPQKTSITNTIATIEIKEITPSKLSSTTTITGDNNYNALLNFQDITGQNPMSIGVQNGEMTFNSGSGKILFNGWGNSAKEVSPKSTKIMSLGSDSNRWKNVVHEITVLKTPDIIPTPVKGAIYFDGIVFKACKDGVNWQTLF